MDAEKLGFATSSFDCVLLHLTLAVVPDPFASIYEAVRVLKPGGRVSIFDKFLPDNARPSLIRRIANVLTSAAFSDINRQLGPLIASAGLTPRIEEKTAGGLYRIAQAFKAST
jgi:ubiquinone/menaquinone biosynthesis C-methylase UbiE